nr:hypothetical protein [Tanacetum cinerariifolium]
TYPTEADIPKVVGAHIGVRSLSQHGGWGGWVKKHD